MIDATFPSELLTSAATLVRERVGLVFPESRRSALVDGLNRAMRRARAKPPEYLDRLASDPAALDDLVGEITVGETYFFREPERFQQIRDEFLPGLLATVTHRPVRIWSAGCATGEEPFSVAIALQEMDQLDRARILGTDLSRASLLRARQASYTRWSMRSAPADLVQRYFIADRERFQLVNSVRKAVEFTYLNLAEDSYPSLAVGVWAMDLILCRNVLIYFDQPTVTQVARRLLATLSDDGWLILGASDPLIAELVPCDVVVTPVGLAYRRAGSARSTAWPRRQTWTEASGSAAEPEPRLPAGAVEHVVEVPPAPTIPMDHAEPQTKVGPDVHRAYRQADYEKAALLAQRALVADNDPAVWIVLVRALANEGKLEEARRAVATAIAHHGTVAELSYLQGVLLAEAGRPDEAAGAARRALYLDPELIVAHCALAGAQARVGRVSNAIRSLRNAERLLRRLEPGAAVPASDGEPAGRLAELVGAQLAVLNRTNE